MFVVTPIWMVYSGQDGSLQRKMEIFDPLPEYMKIRKRPYPWFCHDCNIFDNPCQKKCKEEEKERKEVYENYKRNLGLKK
jgi:hypothetical protein